MKSIPLSMIENAVNISNMLEAEENGLSIDDLMTTGVSLNTLKTTLRLIDACGGSIRIEGERSKNYRLIRRSAVLDHLYEYFDAIDSIKNR